MSTVPNPVRQHNTLVYLHQLILQCHLKQLQKQNTELKYIHDTQIPTLTLFYSCLFYCMFTLAKVHLVNVVVLFCQRRGLYFSEIVFECRTMTTTVPSG